MQRGGDFRCENSRGFEAENRTNALATGKDAVAHGLMNRGWECGFLRQEALQRGVDGQAVFFKECGRFHRGGSEMRHSSRAELKPRSLFRFRARTARPRVFRRLSSAKSRRGLPLLRAASGTHAKAPRLPRIASWPRPGQAAGFPAAALLPRAGRATSQNRASSAALASLQALLSSLDQTFLLQSAGSILSHVPDRKQSFISRKGITARASAPKYASANALRLHR